MAPIHPLRPGRTITGASAVLLPFQDDNHVDWGAFESLVANTAQAGLTPAVNMDTGYANLIDEPTRQEVLVRTKSVLQGGDFIAGAFVADAPNDEFSLEAYRRGIDAIEGQGGTPIIFQSYGLTSGCPGGPAEGYRQVAEHCAAFYAFELSSAFAPFGKIYDLPTYEEILRIPACRGAKHSSLRREPEWERLRLRDEIRPEFHVFTGNDLAIDMVMYGSDYLLGLSAFAPQEFALRDRYWAEKDARFYELNDLLQYLGMFAFREPVPAYKHSAAQFLKLRERIATDITHPRSPQREASDIPVLRDILFRLESLVAEG